MDLILRNASVVDGSGNEGFRGDVGIKDGRIAAVGRIAAHGTKEIDLAGAVAAPGFIDVHTHYDAQVFWDRLVSPSIFHGVTTFIAGNCGFTLAPLSGRAEDTNYLLRMLSRVEGMPLGTLRVALDPIWTSFGQYLDQLDGKLAINSAFLVGHSALRRAVMGERAVGCEATEAEIEAMCVLLGKSLAEGGVGFSTTVSMAHRDFEGQPVPSRWATRDELLRLAGVVRDYPGAWVEVAHGKSLTAKEDYDLITCLSAAAQRPLNWNMLTVDSTRRGDMEAQLAASDYARAHGGAIYALVTAVPPKVIVNLVTGFVLDMIPNWIEILVLPHDSKIRALGDPAIRAKLREGVGKMEGAFVKSSFSDWSLLIIESATTSRNQRWIGRTLGEYAQAHGKDALDALFDLAIEENLNVSFSPPPGGTDDESWHMRAEAWRNPRCIIGASDAGAHIDMINTFAFSTQLLGEGVRRRRLLPLEAAVHLITAVPARRFGLKDRGRIAPGMAADIVVFDPNVIDCGSVEVRNDLPGGEMRLYAEALGISQVMVNGICVVREGRATGKMGGRVLRSGRDTRTVTVDEHVYS
jgi:N-acyl-D-aspartate/D-glutamate deacylase